jgi:hypothetical protein
VLERPSPPNGGLLRQMTLPVACEAALQGQLCDPVDLIAVRDTAIILAPREPQDGHTDAPAVSIQRSSRNVVSASASVMRKT